MAQAKVELDQIAAWFSEEGLDPGSSKEAQLCELWRAFHCVRSHLSSVTRDQDRQRSQHLAEMDEVRKSLEQISIFTEQKDVLVQEIQDENDQLKDRLRQLISLQDTQISEVAKMLYQQGLTELIHSSPSEQVAYLLVERASLLETSEDRDNLTNAGNTISPAQTETQLPNSNAQQKWVPNHGQSPWRKLFGLHKATQSKHTPIPNEARHLTNQSNASVERKCSRLERDLEEGSRRLAMAHNEIRRLTDELESAHLTQKSFESELQAAQQEEEKLRKSGRLSAAGSGAVTVNPTGATAASQAGVTTDGHACSSLIAVLLSLWACAYLWAVEFQVAEVAHSNTTCKDLKEKLAAHTRCPLDTEQTILSLKKDVERLEFALQEQQLQAMQVQAQKANEQAKECPDYQESAKTLLMTQDECETLKKEICETLTCLDKERSKYHELKEKHKTKLCWAKQKLDDETTWRDEKIKSLERELSLCSHSLAKEKELVQSITAENEKLLVERTRLLKLLNEEEHNKKDSNLSIALSKCRVDFLEMENKKLGNKIVHMSNQLAVMERTLQSVQPLHLAEEPQKICDPQWNFTSLPVEAPTVVMPKPFELPTLLDDTQSSHSKQTAIPSPHSLISAALSRSAEMGYLNLASTQKRSDQRASLAVLSSSEHLCS
ncbi:putative leucine-rich repeat-containing protein DDB_G0290503 isoform X3 [Echeneis naucrates]|uniref:putative leucine-rich repeat-containing protein DDB_G0290503 isoform X3 n=1 Tax=Echeneis naucrates TaxID=173247 RepID=UPI00111394F7|nr:putative leucine-rich repeat-containing protein DDB_G0290503 isoform X3 [Echeneis naucrates]